MENKRSKLQHCDTGKHNAKTTNIWTTQAIEDFCLAYSARNKIGNGRASISAVYNFALLEFAKKDGVDLRSMKQKTYKNFQIKQ
jgi:hypothetical protein